MQPKVRRFLTTVNASNCFLCWNPGSREAVIIDPSELSHELRGLVSDLELQIVGVLVTHGHYDHIGALGDAVGAWEAPVFAAVAYPGGETVAHGDVINLRSFAFDVAATPGHTDDSISFLGDGHAFVGDALFAAAVGGTSGRASFERQRDAVREHILSLPDTTVLHPGHGPDTTVAVERCYNPFFVE